MSSSWIDSLEHLGGLIARGEVGEAGALALRLREKREREPAWPPAPLDGLLLYIFEPADGEEGNLKLGKWVDALNRLMRKILEGEFQEVARVTGIMKAYAEGYTPIVKLQQSPAAKLPGLTCRLSPHPPKSSAL